jgi:hypothetical protein
MSNVSHEPVSFGEVLDAVAGLSAEDQSALVDIVRHRLVEQGRKQVAASIEEARKEFLDGQCRPVTIDQLRNEILS